MASVLVTDPYEMITDKNYKEIRRKKTKGIDSGNSHTLCDCWYRSIDVWYKPCLFHHV